ncbi:hypothetical protein CcaCcLH18_08295 [Colletotrichum camelliae]|nr:hypothetical protein CcaCcLH18_08295 [Colletotrichum camelliae]
MAEKGSTMPIEPFDGAASEQKDNAIEKPPAMKPDAEEASDSSGAHTPASSTDEVAEGSVDDATPAGPTETSPSEAETPKPAEQPPESSAVSSPEAPGNSQTKTELPPPPQPFPLPDWLLEHCVTLRETLKDTPDVLDLLGEDAFDPETGRLTKAEKQRIKGQELASMRYAVDEAMFAPFLTLLRDEDQRTAEDPRCFTENVVHLQSHISYDFGCAYRTRFLAGVARQFAKAVGADLVTLERNDYIDFTEDCWGKEDLEKLTLCTCQLFNHVEEPGANASCIPGRCFTTEQTEYWTFQVDDGSAPEDAAESPAKSTTVKWTEPFAAILDAPRAKRRGQPVQPVPDDVSDNIPLVVFLSLNVTEVTSGLVESLRNALTASPASQRTIILIARSTFSYHDYPDTDEGVPGVESFPVLPVATPRMKLLLQADGSDEQRRKNTRYIQRRVRHRRPNANRPPLTKPYAPWDFLGSSLTSKFMIDNTIGASWARRVLKCLGDTTTDEQIKRTVLGMRRQNTALDAWADLSSDDSSDDSGDEAETAEVEDQWSKFPEHARESLRNLSERGSEYEQRILPLIVDPVAAEEAWASIAVDEEMVATVKRVVAHHQKPDSTRASYGILKREHTGGALFYGPPGTGKTHLARVLAATTDSIVISATSGDIQSMYCGESPKVIKALFNVARRIAPSIIFIDEADSLFSVRSTGSSSASIFYRETTTQLLTEMDGFSKSKDTPLVILATSLPTILDPAVLRRVPNITYMGPPTVTLREEIFRIMLRGEVLDPAIDMARLAQMTPGYSGSDIKSLCVKAALMCDTFVESGEDEGKRLLTMPFFEQALAGAEPTAVNAALRSLREFAKKHDPAGLRKMQMVDAELDSA